MPREPLIPAGAAERDRPSPGPVNRLTQSATDLAGH